MSQLDKKILVIYTGGTFGMVYDEASSLLKPYAFERIHEFFPELKKLNVKIDFKSIIPAIDSSNLEPELWFKIALEISNKYSVYQGFIVIHGTDTMAYSASALSFILQHVDKPVIFTGAQLPVSALRSDARDNFLTALEIASATDADGKAIIQEVCIYFNNFLLRGNRAKKVESAHFDAFESPNCPPLAESGINIDYNIPFNTNIKKSQFNINLELELDLACIKLYPGISEKYVRTLLDNMVLKGVLIETYGSGNAPTFSWLKNVFKSLQDQEIVIYNVSQCYKGHVNHNRYETGRHLQEYGVVSGKDITFEAGITKLMHVLGQKLSFESSKQLLFANIAGEISS